MLKKNSFFRKNLNFLIRKIFYQSSYDGYMRNSLKILKWDYWIVTIIIYCTLNPPSQLQGGELYLDKAYADELLKQTLQGEQEVAMLTPVKKAKGQKYLDAVDQWLSVAVSRVRQPIESLFNWIEEKTGIQRASKVRSYPGLLVHVFGRLAAAMWLMAEAQGT